MSIEGQAPYDKIMVLLETYLAAQIRTCNQEISQYEIKYRSTFEEFAEAWEQGSTPDRHSYEIERDYMEWEGLVAEKRRWLKRLSNLLALDKK